MDPDDFQKAWKAHSDETRLSIHSDAFMASVRRSARNFDSMIFLRDFREVGLIVLMLPLWFYMGYALSLPWTWYLMVPALLWSGAFIVIDRMRHARKPSEPDALLLDNAREALHQVNHQIWLLRNVHWWYLLPFAVPILIFFADTALSAPGTWGEKVAVIAIMWAALIALYAFIYYLNQFAVRKTLKPRRDELAALIDSLRDESADGARGDYPVLTREEAAPGSIWQAVVGIAIVVTLLALMVPAVEHFQRRADGEYAKLSPFDAVRWDDMQPEVMLDGEWFDWIAINGIPTEDIVAFSQTYDARWKKRVEEDLVELLTVMGHPPDTRVTLVVRSLTTLETQTLEGVRMTRANRNAIRDAARDREAEQERREAVREGIVQRKAEEPVEGGRFSEELERIRATHKLPAMAAFALRDREIIERATTGTRSTKDGTPVGANAQWHLGSNTKAMTATVAGLLVEEGLLEWESTIGEILGEAAPEMVPAHNDTTLAMLLHHTGGITPNINWFSAPKDRLTCVAQVLSAAPSKRGSYVYSNGGYVVAGAMMEVVTGKRWEDLMREKLFQPLGMTNTGFGAPTGSNAPWGHDSRWLRWKPMDPEEHGSDNAPVLGPAGTVHTTLDDYALFVAAHLKGAQGDGGIVSAETFATLHAPLPAGDYGMGWIVTERGWSRGRVLTHGGSNTLWYTSVWIAPGRDMAFFAATNAGGDEAGKAVNEAIEALIWRHLD